MKIYLAADHRGFKLKEFLKQALLRVGYEVIDSGNDHYDEADDYPDFTAKAAASVAADPESRGVLLCGSGVGADMVANKTKGVRSVLAINEAQAVASRKDDDTSIISLPADYLSESEAEKIVLAWLVAPFSGEERYKRRLQKVAEWEAKQ